MAFKGVTFNGQNSTPKNDGGLYMAHHGDGILWGCGMSISGDNLVIDSGEFIGCGRVCFVDGATEIDLSSRTITDGYIQVVMDYDISNYQGYQWHTHLPLIESPTTTFFPLNQFNINDTGVIYQFQLAIVQVSGGVLTSITSHMGYSDLRVKNEDGDVARMVLRQDRLFQVGTIESSGLLKNGMTTNSAGNTLICAPQMDIILRPNGWGDNTNQFRFYPDGHVAIPGDIQIGGQQTGGHPVTTKTVAGPVNLSGGHTIIESITDLVSSGVYMATASFLYKASASTAHWPIFGFGTSASLSAYDLFNQPYIANASERRMCISGLYTGHASCRLLGSTQSSSITGQITNVEMHLVRLS